MKLEKFYNKTIIIEDLKRFFGVSILYFIAVFVSGPLYIFSQSDISRGRELERIIELVDGKVSHGGMAIVVGILLGVLLFRYLHNKNSVAVIHGYPFKRSEILNSHIISGIILISVPLLLNTIILALTIPRITTNIDMELLFGSNIDVEKIAELYSTKKIIYWFLKMEIMSIIFFLISAFTAIISGVTIIQSALAFILPFVPPFIIVVLYQGLGDFIFGFGAAVGKWNNFAVNIIPLSISSFRGNTTWQLGYVIWYILFCILLYSISLWLYKKRDLERTQDTIVFDILKPVFKYGVTFCAMLLAGIYFYALKENTMWLLIGVFVGSFLGYFISEMIIKKSLWVFKSLKGYIIYVAVIAVMVVGIKADLFGYERKIPNANQVKEVYFKYLDHDRGMVEKQNIESVLDIHRTIIDNKEDILKAQKQEDYLEATYISIGYLYTDGKRVTRSYGKVPQSLLDNHIKKLYESDEYKRIANKTLLELDLNKVDSVNITNYYYGKRKIILDKNEIKELFEVLKEERFAQSYENMLDENAWARIEFNVDDGWNSGSSEYYSFYRYLGDRRSAMRDVGIDFKKIYFNLEEWFTQKGYLKDIRIMPEEIKYIVIQKANKDYDIHNRGVRDIEQDLRMGSSKRVEIKDKQEIEEILRTYNSRSEDKKYIVGIYTENGKMNYGWYNEENALKYFK